MSHPAHDKEFNLVSLLYHASQGANRSQRHALDAKSRSDWEAQEFFTTLSKDYANIADQARMLLKQRM